MNNLLIKGKYHSFKLKYCEIDDNINDVIDD